MFFPQFYPQKVGETISNELSLKYRGDPKYDGPQAKSELPIEFNPLKLTPTE